VLADQEMRVCRGSQVPWGRETATDAYQLENGVAWQETEGGQIQEIEVVRRRCWGAWVTLGGRIGGRPEESWVVGREGSWGQDHGTDREEGHGEGREVQDHQDRIAGSQAGQDERQGGRWDGA
jgi:hypothetical protein